MLDETLGTQTRQRAFTRRTRKRDLRRKLAMQRQMTALLDHKIVAASDDIVLEREDWVEAFVDYGHCFSFDGGKITAFRAIAVHDGSLFWLVRKNGKAKGYHSDRTDPLGAVEQAEAAWQGRKRVRRDWSAVEALARDLLLGRRALRVRIEDAHASALCTMGVTAFMRQMRISHIQEISGRLAAILMWIDPQVGFVIHQAHLRETQNAELSAKPVLDAAR